MKKLPNTLALGGASEALNVGGGAIGGSLEKKQECY